MTGFWEYFVSMASLSEMDGSDVGRHVFFACRVFSFRIGNVLLCWAVFWD